jgi:sRNA-binding regulator protein Hfq
VVGGCVSHERLSLGPPYLHPRKASHKTSFNLGRDERRARARTFNTLNVIGITILIKADKTLTDGTRAGPKDESFNGTRKLIRPHLPTEGRRSAAVHTEDPLSHAMVADHIASLESSHAEAFYFQKQIQQQTEMTVVLEDGEELDGVVEWYDKCVLKLKTGRSRVMIYKSGVKYLYKASEAHPRTSVMK